MRTVCREVKPRIWGYKREEQGDRNNCLYFFPPDWNHVCCSPVALYSKRACVCVCVCVWDSINTHWEQNACQTWLGAWETPMHKRNKISALWQWKIFSIFTFPKHWNDKDITLGYAYFYSEQLAPTPNLHHITFFSIRGRVCILKQRLLKRSIIFETNTIE